GRREDARRQAVLARAGALAPDLLRFALEVDELDDLVAVVGDDDASGFQLANSGDLAERLAPLRLWRGERANRYGLRPRLRGVKRGDGAKRCGERESSERVTHDGVR